MKATPGAGAADRERYWTKIIQESREYPGGITAFCADKGVSHHAYYFWFTRLRGAHPEWKNLTSNTKQRRRKAQKKTQPETEVTEKARRRRFTAKDKMRILQETDSAKPGQTAAILRREGIYASHLQQWRLQRDELALAPKKRGPKVDDQAARIKELEAKTARLEKRLAHAHALIDLQKKVAEILGTDLQNSEEER